MSTPSLSSRAAAPAPATSWEMPPPAWKLPIPSERQMQEKLFKQMEDGLQFVKAFGFRWEDIDHAKTTQSVSSAKDLLPSADGDILYPKILYARFRETNERMYQYQIVEFKRLAEDYAKFLADAFHSLRPEGPAVNEVVKDGVRIKVFVTGALPRGKTEAAYIKEWDQWTNSKHLTTGRFQEVLGDKIAALPVGPLKTALSPLLPQELVTICSLFAAGKEAQAFKRWNFLPVAMRNAIYGYTYKLEKKAGRDVGHPDFGNAAFNGKLIHRQIGNAVRCEAIGCYLLSLIAEMMRTNKENEHLALELFKSLPENQRNTIYGLTYRHQKATFDASMAHAKQTTDNFPKFGEEAFLKTLRVEAYHMTNAARAEVMEAYLKMLG